MRTYIVSNTIGFKHINILRQCKTSSCEIFQNDIPNIDLFCLSDINQIYIYIYI